MTTLEVIASQNIEEIRKLFKRPAFDIEPENAMAEYNVGDHDVYSQSKRPMRKVKYDSGTADSEGKAITSDIWVDVVRVGVPFQKIIAKRRVGFMLTDPVTVKAIYAADTETEKELALVKKVAEIQDANKMDYRNKEIFRRKISECECAVLWYFAETGLPAPKFTLNSKILSPELGDTLYPLFDEFGKMISFAREYSVINGTAKELHYDVYTEEADYYYVDRGGLKLDDLLPVNPIPNQAKKLMIEYYQQAAPVWADVQKMIARYETLTSNHGGMNDKFGAPLLTVAGEITGMITDNATGSILQLENGATAEYKSLASEPASISLEQKNLVENIYTMSQTPDISFESMKGIGNISGIALKLMFADAHMACSDEEETFGIGIQRRLNIIKNAIGTVIDTSLAKEAQTVQLKPVFHPFLPTNVTEIINDLTVAVTGGIMSKETAVELNPLIVDKEGEKARVEGQAAKDFQAGQ